MLSELQQLGIEMAEVVTRARRCLVRIGNGHRGEGAGTIVRPDGLILTNAHVVRREAPTVMLPGGSPLRARVVSREAGRDLALLSVEADGLPAIALADGARLRPGQWVFALGHPWGVAGAATAGVVIGAGAEMPEMPANQREWVMVSLRLRPGNSGGPLIDAQGRLIGVNTIMTGPKVGGAVPVRVVRDFLREALGDSALTAWA